VREEVKFNQGIAENELHCRAQGARKSPTVVLDSFRFCCCIFSKLHNQDCIRLRKKSTVCSSDGGRGIIWS
jgi:hypothetical protein